MFTARNNFMLQKVKTINKPMKNVVKPRATCKILSLKLVIFIVKTNVSKLSKYSK